MKIGMILDESFPPDPRVENEADTLIQAGHEVYLFCLDFDKNDKPQEDVISGINIRRYKCNKLTYKLSALAYTFPFYHLIMKSKIRAFLIQNDIRTIHIHDLRIARAVFWLNRNNYFKIILDLHENRPEIMQFYTHVNSPVGKLLISPKKWKKFEYKYIRTANNVIVVTNAAKQYYLAQVNIQPNKIFVVPNTIRKSFYESFYLDEAIIQKYRNNYVLLYLGDTGIRRGTKNLINAIPYLTKQIPNIKLVIVGKSKDDQLLKKEVEKLNIKQYVDLLGWQPFIYFQSYIKAANIGMSPLHRNIHHDTTYANKIFQYASLGLPIIVSDSTAQKEVVEKLKNGLVHKAEDAKDIANMVLRLYLDKDQYSSFSKNAMNGIKNEFHWEATSKELIDLYNQIQ